MSRFWAPFCSVPIQGDAVHSSLLYRLNKDLCQPTSILDSKIQYLPAREAVRMCSISHEEDAAFAIVGCQAMMYMEATGSRELLYLDGSTRTVVH